MIRLNEIVISSCINKLYGIKLNELLYDSEIDRYQFDSHSSCTDSHDNIFDSVCDTICDTVCDSCDTSCDSFDLPSDDDYYSNLFKKKNCIESQCFGKKNLIFITIDNHNNTYGCFFPERIDSDENYSMYMSLFTITKGIEIIEKKYEFVDIMNCISFPKDCLYCIGEGNQWVYKVVNDGCLQIVWNDKQKLITCYNRTIMKTSPLKRIVVYSTVNRENEDSFVNVCAINTNDNRNTFDNTTSENDTSNNTCNDTFNDIGDDTRNDTCTVYNQCNSYGNKFNFTLPIFNCL